MSDSKRCERCGGPLPQAGVLGGRCPRCMVELGLESTSGFGNPERIPSAQEDTSAAPVIGSYTVLRLIGEGGMGAVYEAEQKHPRRKVALKIIRAGMAGRESLRRFELEAEALGRLQHPNIAQIYEAGTADTGFGPQPYFAMEFICGRTLLDHVRARNLNVRERLELVAKIADAVHHAHQRGLIHRDLKPSNILVDETGQPKVLDFGVARVTDSGARSTLQTETGQLVGTLAYMSPEQVSGDPLEIDTRADVYALGVVLYELLAGHPPYNPGMKFPDAIQAIREEDPARLSVVDRAYRGDIETIAVKALEKDKARRYASAAELAADIRRYLKDEPIVARPPSISYHLQKFARRHRAMVLGVAAVFAVLVTGVVVSTRQAARARSAEQAAVVERDRARHAEGYIATSADETNHWHLLQRWRTSWVSRAWTAPAATPLAAPQVPGYLKIVFTSTQHANNCGAPQCDLDSQDGELYIMNRNGSGQTRITFDNVPEFGARWSPDGSGIAFHGQVALFGQIFLVSANGARQLTGTGPRTDTGAGAQFPNWSPDGRRIVFNGNQVRNGTVIYRDIFVINVDGAGLTNLTHNSTYQDLRPAWSPDGTRIAFQTNRDGNDEIYVMNADGTDPLRLTSVGRADQAPDWSPDGRKIVFQSNRDGNFEIWVVNADGTGQMPLTHTEAPVRNLQPAWSPDGSEIAFASDRDFPQDAILQVFVMSADGTNPVSLTSLPGQSAHPAWGWTRVP